MKQNTQDIYHEAGMLILSSRLRRLSERILSEVSRIYRELEIPFEPAWFPLFFLLERESPLAITELARRLRVSQPAVSQMAVTLEARGLIRITQNDQDRRRKALSFTAEGLSLLRQIQPVWESLNRQSKIFLGEDPHSRGMLAILNEVEEALEQRDLARAVLEEVRWRDK